jgi:hypothetical protein
MLVLAHPGSLSRRGLGCCWQQVPGFSNVSTYVQHAACRDLPPVCLPWPVIPVDVCVRTPLMHAGLLQLLPRLREDVEEGYAVGDRMRTDARASVVEGCCGYMLQALRDAGYKETGQAGSTLPRMLCGGCYSHRHPLGMTRPVTGHRDLVLIASCSLLLD